MAKDALIQTLLVFLAASMAVNWAMVVALIFALKPGRNRTEKALDVLFPKEGSQT